MEINNKFLDLLHKIETMEGISLKASSELSNDVKELRTLVFSKLGMANTSMQKESDIALKRPPFDFERIIKEMLNLYIKKNHDYGNSFSETIQEFGFSPAVARINDKFKRVKQMVLGEQMLVNESMRDNLIDIANYCVLTIVELDKQNDCKNKENCKI